MFSKARNNFESTRAEVERLMKRIRSAEEDFKAPGSFTMEGYLYIQEKREARARYQPLLLPRRAAGAPTWWCTCRSVGQRLDQVLLYL